MEKPADFSDSPETTLDICDLDEEDVINQMLESLNETNNITSKPKKELEIKCMKKADHSHPQIDENSQTKLPPQEADFKGASDKARSRNYCHENNNGGNGDGGRRGQKTSNDNLFRFRPYMEHTNTDNNRNAQRAYNNGDATFEEGRTYNGKQGGTPPQQRPLTRQERAAAFEQKQQRKQEQHREQAQLKLQLQQQQNGHAQQPWLGQQQQNTGQQQQNLGQQQQNGRLQQLLLCHQLQNGGIQQPWLGQQQHNFGQQQQNGHLEQTWLGRQQQSSGNQQQNGRLQQPWLGQQQNSPNQTQQQAFNFQQLPADQLHQLQQLLLQQPQQQLALLSHLPFPMVASNFNGLSQVSPNSQSIFLDSVIRSNMNSNFAPLDTKASLEQILQMNCGAVNAVPSLISPGIAAGDTGNIDNTILLKALASTLLNEVKPINSSLEQSNGLNQSLISKARTVVNSFSSSASNLNNGNDINIRCRNSFGNFPPDTLIGMHPNINSNGESQSLIASISNPNFTNSKPIENTPPIISTDLNAWNAGNMAAAGANALPNFSTTFNGFQKNEINIVSKNIPFGANNGNALSDFKNTPPSTERNSTSTIKQSAKMTDYLQSKPRTVGEILGLTHEEMFGPPTRRVMDMVRNLLDI